MAHCDNLQCIDYGKWKLWGCEHTYPSVIRCDEPRCTHFETRVGPGHLHVNSFRSKDLSSSGLKKGIMGENEFLFDCRGTVCVKYTTRSPSNCRGCGMLTIDAATLHFYETNGSQPPFYNQSGRFVAKPIGEREQFWMVNGGGEAGSKIRKPSEKAAEQEAERLARLHPGQRFAVLKAVSSFIVEETVTRKVVETRSPQLRKTTL